MAIKNVLSVTSEIFPMIKTGGLADVAGALPGALKANGLQVKSLVPGYPAILAATDQWQAIATIPNFFGGAARLLMGRHEASGLELIALDAPWLYDRPGNPYLDADGTDWPDNAQRYAALSAAAAQLAQGLVPGWIPDIVHCHDWQTGLAPAYLRWLGSDCPSLLTIHNIAFQGVFAPTLIPSLQLPPGQFSVEGYEYFGQIGMLKAGIYYADAISTVSPGYAREIQTSAFGMGLEGLLSSRRAMLKGIVNGIDDTIWNPSSDPALAKTYDAATLSKRATNKRTLQRRFGLEMTADAPLFCVVSRLTTQKGMDLILNSLEHLTGQGGQLALIGTGDAIFEAGFTTAAKRFAGSVGCIIGYDETVSHQLQGGGDAILIPSRFEPCGLTQLYGLRYGCVPVVTRVGGLADTVIDANDAALQDGVATGIHLSAIDQPSLNSAIERTVELYRQNGIWQAMQKRGMSRDLSWRRAAGQYAQLYQTAQANRQNP